LRWNAWRRTVRYACCCGSLPAALAVDEHVDCRLIRPRSSTIQPPSAGCALERAQQLEHRVGLELVLLSAAGQFSQRAVDADEGHGPILRLRAVLNPIVGPKTMSAAADAAAGCGLPVRSVRTALPLCRRAGAWGHR
jgi:hypothetical protein